VTDLTTRLQEVLECGDPAQREQAGRLLTTLAADPQNPGARRDAELLADAYLNDPHLTR
jgi:hypothetical protein